MEDQVELELEHVAAANVGGRDDPFCLKLLAGELRWIAHRDAAMERQLLVEAKRLEDRYYTERRMLEERKTTATTAAEVEVQDMKRFRDQLVLEMDLEPWSMVDDDI